MSLHAETSAAVHTHGHTRARAACAAHATTTRHTQHNTPPPADTTSHTPSPRVQEKAIRTENEKWDTHDRAKLILCVRLLFGWLPPPGQTCAALGRTQAHAERAYAGCRVSRTVRLSPPSTSAQPPAVCYQHHVRFAGWSPFGASLLVTGPGFARACSFHAPQLERLRNSL